LDSARVDAILPQHGHGAAAKSIVGHHRGKPPIVAKLGELSQDIGFGSADPAVEMRRLKRQLGSWRRQSKQYLSKGNDGHAGWLALVQAAT
jgi:hypothetical protein